MLYPDLLFPGIKQFYNENEEKDVVLSERILSTVNPASYYSCAKTIDNLAPDLFLTRYWMPYLGLSLGKVAQKLSQNIIKIAIVDSFHTANEQFRAAKNNVFFIKHYDGFIIMNEESEKYLLSINPEATFVKHPLPAYSYINNPIEKNKAKRILNVPENKNILLFFGEIRDYKGLDILLQSCSQLDDNFHLIIAGEAHNSFDYYQNMIEKLKIIHKISLNIRYINPNEAPFFLSAADVLVLPCKEKLPREVINHSFLYNLPIITTDMSDSSQVVENNKLGIIIEKADAALLTAAIQNYFTQKLYDVFSPNIVTYNKNNSWESFAASIYNLYDKLSHRNDLLIY